MTGRGKRTLSEKERALWELATSDVRRAARPSPGSGDRQDPSDSRDKPEIEEAETGTGHGGGARPSGSRSARKAVAPRPVQSIEFDRKLYKRLSTGR